MACAAVSGRPMRVSRGIRQNDEYHDSKEAGYRRRLSRRIGELHS